MASTWQTASSNTATLDLYSARQALIQLRLARAVNSVNLCKALGGGWWGLIRHLGYSSIPPKNTPARKFEKFLLFRIAIGSGRH